MGVDCCATRYVPAAAHSPRARPRYMEAERRPRGPSARAARAAARRHARQPLPCTTPLHKGLRATIPTATPVGFRFSLPVLFFRPHRTRNRTVRLYVRGRAARRRSRRFAQRSPEVREARVILRVGRAARLPGEAVGAGQRGGAVTPVWKTLGVPWEAQGRPACGPHASAERPNLGLNGPE